MGRRDIEEAAGMTEIITIEVHCCMVCGDHAREQDYGAEPVPTTTGQNGQRGMFVPFMAVCSSCGLLACFSCLGDGACCDRRKEMEAARMPEIGQMEMFEDSVEGSLMD